ncbi:MAG TPA: IS1182 family transposase [Verrucomicrobiae bacterium]|nr:IS1182 family transposase [Verrucomicrobiae bacterium]
MGAHAQRIARAVRDPVELVPQSLEERVAPEHPARAIWAVLERLDLGAFYTRIRAAVDGPGRPASDPRVLLGLWLLATVEGIGSARRLARLSEEHDAYRWLRGGVPVNYHLLADFRVAHQAELDALLTQTIALLMREDLVTLQRVAQDGVRVRAAAGSGSFRRRASLERCLTEAQEQVTRLAAERDAPEAHDPTVTRKEQAARERAARERRDRVERALQALPELEAIKAKQRQKLSKERQQRVPEARVSTTDPDVRVMKMGDGGFRPALNIQLATTGDGRAIVGVQVSPQGSDGGLAAPLEAQVVERTGQHPTEYLIDGGLATRDDITALAAHDVTVYAPVEPPRTTTSGRTAYDPRPDDTPAVAAWRQRMGTEDGRTTYRHRSGIAEWTNAQLRFRHGLQRFTVRGVDRVTSVVLLLTVTHNLLRYLALTA